jgi:hypothetical protein
MTNLVASQALRGQSAKVTLSLEEFSTFLGNPLAQIGTVMYTDGIYGTIGSIDSFGNSFEIVPIQPNLTFSSPDLPGYLKEGANVQFD